MSIQISLIGLGQIGASIGLALKEHSDLVKRVGHDRDPGVARRAEKLGAVDSISFNLPAAVRQADIVVLASPVDDLRNILEVIGPELKEGAVVIDTSPVKVAVAQWATEILPPGRHFISWTPAINPAYLYEAVQGVESAHADLFKNSLILTTTPPNASAQALRLSSDLVGLLGAHPLYADLYEVDGLAASSQILPQLAAVALLNSTMDQPGWQESRKIAGRSYMDATQPVLHIDDVEKFGQAAILNKDNTVRVIDDLIFALRDLRQAVYNQDGETLHKAIEHARSSREQWLHQRQAGIWENMPADTELPSKAEIYGRMVGLGGRKKDKSKK
jgi:prephenate dehydrogenase